MATDWLASHTRIRPTTRLHYTRDVELVLIPRLATNRLTELSGALLRTVFGTALVVDGGRPGRLVVAGRSGPAGVPGVVGRHALPREREPARPGHPEWPATPLHDETPHPPAADQHPPQRPHWTPDGRPDGLGGWPRSACNNCSAAAQYSRGAGGPISCRRNPLPVRSAHCTTIMSLIRWSSVPNLGLSLGRQPIAGSR